MRRHLTNLLITVSLLVPVYCGAAQSKPAPVFPIAAVIEQVKREIAAAQATPGASLNLVLQKVEATFAVARTVDANGKATIGIPAISVEGNLGGSLKTEENSTIYVELMPPKPLGVLSGAELKDLGLTEAIVETRRELLKGLLDEPKLEPRKVIITVKFAATRAGAGGAQVKLVVVSLGGGAGITTANTNTVVLTFGKSGAP